MLLTCHRSGGDVWVDGETGEGGVDPGADEALPPHPRLHQVSRNHDHLGSRQIHDDHSGGYDEMITCQFSELKSFRRKSQHGSSKIKSTMN